MSSIKLMQIIDKFNESFPDINIGVITPEYFPLQSIEQLKLYMTCLGDYVDSSHRDQSDNCFCPLHHSKFMKENSGCDCNRCVFSILHSEYNQAMDGVMSEIGLGNGWYCPSIKRRIRNSCFSSFALSGPVIKYTSLEERYIFFQLSIDYAREVYYDYYFNQYVQKRLWKESISEWKANNIISMIWCKHEFY